MLQQEERRNEHATAEDCGDAEAPPLSALFPQGSTLLRGQCTRADNNTARGDGENIGTPRTVVQMKMHHSAMENSFPLVRANSRVSFP